MVPGIRNNRLAVFPPADRKGQTKQRLLYYYRYDSSEQGNFSRTFKRLIHEIKSIYLIRPFPEKADSYAHQDDTDDRSGQRFILTMPVVMPFILRL